VRGTSFPALPQNRAVLQTISEEQDGYERLVSFLRLDGDSKEFSDESRLAETVSFVHPLHLSFSDPVYLSYLWNVLHTVSNEQKPIPGFTRRLMRTMILFNALPHENRP
jgi:hypothetical protein